MRQLLSATLLLPCLWLGLAAPLAAAPRQYALDDAASTVGFSTRFGPDLITGTFPVTAADLAINFAALGESRVSVVMDASHGHASFPFATQAMQGPKVLDAAHWPEIRFTSTAIRRDGEGAVIEGLLTLHGQTRPVALQAVIYRQRGTAEGDLSHLTILLHGAISRAEFGATGWADMVDDRVEIDIRALIREPG